MRRRSVAWATGSSRRAAARGSGVVSVVMRGWRRRARKSYPGSRERSLRTSSRRLSWSSRQAGQPSRWAPIPGTRASASSPASSSSTYSSSRSKHSSQLTSGPSGPSKSSIIVCHLPELAAGVVQGLVQRAARRAEPLGEHLVLVRGELGADGVLEGAQELLLLEPLMRGEAGVGDLRPALLVDLDLA